MTTKRLLLAGLLFLFIAGVTDVLMLASIRVPFSNRVYRVIARAPAVHLQGELLVYHGWVPADAASLEPSYTSDEGYALGKANGTPTPPPYMFLKAANGGYFKYSWASRPWSV